ncbi:unnamed protein product [Acanthoscelides obtectus]|uniref:Uncharacterized protein n=1 Tax=Acanthoscelides obtectus TaxID=200917 RepID=A0A9P0KMQ1_ACAOB|nr:unnamed protein product [Acanthoscelides obtectus]CAK1666708.1 hypothetical protein AOBTE_LOCUS25444 [Acanthoscelides obtectus]
MPKSHVLLLGGTGFIGRNIVYYWLKEKKVESIVVVDKVPPELAWMNQAHRDAFNDPRVEFKSANLVFPGKRLGYLYFKISLIVNIPRNLCCPMC